MGNRGSTPTRLRTILPLVLLLSANACAYSPQPAQALTDGPTVDMQPAVAGIAHQWSFDDGTATDLVGTADGVLFDGASIDNGALQLDGVDDYMRTAPIDETIGERTLVVWVTLTSVTQRSGGALVIEDPTGTDVFDGVVFAERVPEQWMAGSDFFRRTIIDNGGALEATSQRRMIAIVYDQSAGITLYRDGQLYGDRYVLDTLQSYPAGVADVLVGVRHQDRIGQTGGTPDGNDPFLAAIVDEARIYDRALAADDVARLVTEGP